MASYRDVLRDRLQQIDEIGTGQTTWERLQASRRAAQNQFNTDYAMQDAYGKTRALAQQNINSMNASANAPFEKFAAAIGRKESNNNYRAVNKDSGAMGKYQIMPSNIYGARRGWDYEALGYDVNERQFLSSPQIQETIARYKLQQYYNKYGPTGASIAWYAGPAAANYWQKTGRISTAPQSAYPSIAGYAQQIARMFQ